VRDKFIGPAGQMETQRIGTMQGCDLLTVREANHEVETQHSGL
jgi:hypothetical protein